MAIHCQDYISGPLLSSPWLSGKEFTCNAGDKGDPGLILGSGRSPGEGHGNPLQYSCLENPMDRGVWWTTGSQRVGPDEGIEYFSIH